MIGKIHLSSPHMGGTEEKYVQEAFDTNWIAPLGKNVIEFENQLKKFTGINAACAVSSGTSAIHVALDLLGVGKGDTVFCSSLTFIASVNPVLYLGAQPVFIDSDMESWNMSPEALAKAFEKYERKGEMPKAVVIVNLYGQSSKMDELLPICKKYGVPIVEDAAESLGAIYKGKMSGTFGTLGIFSFNGNKIITTSGGGMIISDDEKLMDRALKKATQSKDDYPYYQHSEVGYNYRLSNVSAGIGRGQMEVLEDRIEKKREIFKQYEAGLGNIAGLTFMPEMKDSFHTRWLTTLTVDYGILNVTPLEIIKHLAEFNIEARHVWKPMHLQPIFSQFDYINIEDDNAQNLFTTGLCLPSDTKMTERNIAEVTGHITSLLNKSQKIYGNRGSYLEA